jgi:flagellar biosynthesis/type III secretory pathway protein FliH
MPKSCDAAQPITTRLPQTVIEALRVLAKQEARTVSSLIAAAVAADLQRRGIEPKKPDQSPAVASRVT